MTWTSHFTIQSQFCQIIIFKNFVFSFQTLFHVINKTTGKSICRRFYGDTMVVFHHINAYETNEHVVFDLICYKDSNLYNMFYLNNLKQDTKSFLQSNKDYSPPTCQRFALPLNIDKVNTPVFNNLAICSLSVVRLLMSPPGISQRNQPGDFDGHISQGSDAGRWLSLLPA